MSHAHPFFPRLALVLVGLALVGLASCASFGPMTEIGKVGSLLLEAKESGDVFITPISDLHVITVRLKSENREEAADKLTRLFTEGRDWCEAHHTREVPVWNYPELVGRARFTEDGSTFFLTLTMGGGKENRENASVTLTEELTRTLIQILNQAPEFERAGRKGF